MMNLLSSPPVLRAVVWFDASTGVLLGAFHLLLTASLTQWLGLPQGLLAVTGVMLLGYAALATAIASAHALPRGLLFVLIVANSVWALGSLVVAAEQRAHAHDAWPGVPGGAHGVGCLADCAARNRHARPALVYCVALRMNAPIAFAWRCQAPCRTSHPRVA